MKKVSLEVNGKKIVKNIPDHTILSVLLRDILNLTGTHIGCDTSQCGACVVHVDGNSIKSCTTLAVDLDGSKITTIEGLAKNGKMHPMQKAFKKLHGLQCGFCTPGMVMSAVDLLKNKKNPSDKEIPDHTILSVLLRDILNLTGTHIGCDTSQCGACVVHVDGKSIKSCTAFAADLNGSKITTIEGLAKNGKMHPMQEAFKKMHGLQCGFCTPGMVMSAIDLLKNNKNPSDAEIRDWLEGNICRCTGYQNIVAAVKEAASKM